MTPGNPQADQMAEALLKTYPCAAPKAPTSPMRAVKTPETIVSSPLVKLQCIGKQRWAGCTDQLLNMPWLSPRVLETDSGQHRSCSGGCGADPRTGLLFLLAPFYALCQYRVTTALYFTLAVIQLQKKGGISLSAESFKQLTCFPNTQPTPLPQFKARPR